MIGLCLKSSSVIYSFLLRNKRNFNCARLTQFLYLGVSPALEKSLTHGAEKHEYHTASLHRLGYAPLPSDSHRSHDVVPTLLGTLQLHLGIKKRTDLWIVVMGSMLSREMSWQCCHTVGNPSPFSSFHKSKFLCITGETNADMHILQESIVALHVHKSHQHPNHFLKRHQ